MTKRLENMLRYAIYARISTRGQSNNASLDLQVERCKEFGDARQWSLVKTIAVQETGRKFERPGLSDAQKLIRHARADIIVVYKVDRVARDPTVFRRFIKNVCEAGGQVAVVEDDVVLKSLNAVEDNELIQLKPSFGKMEVDSLYGRVSDGMYQSAREKGFLTNTCFGYKLERARAGSKNVKVPVVAELEAAVIRRVFREVAAGRTTRQVPRALNEDGATPARVGYPWTYTQVRRIVQQYGMRYAGEPFTHVRKIRSGTVSVEYRYPQIVTPQEVTDAQRMIESRRLGKPTHKSPLRRRTNCTTCGRGGAIFSTGGKAYHSWRYYIYCNSYLTQHTYLRSGHGTGHYCRHGIPLNYVLDELQAYVKRELQGAQGACHMENLFEIMRQHDHEIRTARTDDARKFKWQRTLEAELTSENSNPTSLGSLLEVKSAREELNSRIDGRAQSLEAIETLLGRLGANTAIQANEVNWNRDRIDLFIAHTMKALDDQVHSLQHAISSKDADALNNSIDALGLGITIDFSAEDSMNRLESIQVVGGLVEWAKVSP